MYDKTITVFNNKFTLPNEEPLTPQVMLSSRRVETSLPRSIQTFLGDYDRNHQPMFSDTFDQRATPWERLIGPSQTSPLQQQPHHLQVEAAPSADSDDEENTGVSQATTNAPVPAATVPGASQTVNVPVITPTNTSVPPTTQFSSQTVSSGMSQKTLTTVPQVIPAPLPAAYQVVGTARPLNEKDVIASITTDLPYLENPDLEAVNIISMNKALPQEHRPQAKDDLYDGTEVKVPNRQTITNFEDAIGQDIEAILDQFIAKQKQEQVREQSENRNRDVQYDAQRDNRRSESKDRRLTTSLSSGENLEDLYTLLQQHGVERKQLLCYKCGKTGHFARECPWANDIDRFFKNEKLFKEWLSITQKKELSELSSLTTDDVTSLTTIFNTQIRNPAQKNYKTAESLKQKHIRRFWVGRRTQEAQNSMKQPHTRKPRRRLTVLDRVSKLEYNPEVQSVHKNRVVQIPTSDIPKTMRSQSTAKTSILKQTERVYTVARISGWIHGVYINRLMQDTGSNHSVVTMTFLNQLSNPPKIIKLDRPAFNRE
ncbi:hypothetical protein BCR33DRAFT_752103 [Rhizoclosmatium globosum]|uniref:CCHC-type domain-containing protein n=1 Tax=Rhizoclosmatium globosum TaxID=329046 RepID=A0A1Y1ZNY5_9FUNG|nr:hypothetical protein BCR33DRAFT_752103 [Rhizoclosmatium globosum]|eukprot:ORY11946.1 hypothetical protein BCR33DRAFT_752103 [Rhizoclosmatium globosum]